jgi:hypothetical protein
VCTPSYSIELHNESDYGDVCRSVDDKSQWKCPTGCSVAPCSSAPFCLMSGSYSPCRLPRANSISLNATSDYYDSLLQKSVFKVEFKSGAHIDQIIFYYTDSSESRFGVLGGGDGGRFELDDASDGCIKQLNVRQDIHLYLIQIVTITGKSSNWYGGVHSISNYEEVIEKCTFISSIFFILHFYKSVI